VPDPESETTTHPMKRERTIAIMAAASAVLGVVIALLISNNWGSLGFVSDERISAPLNYFIAVALSLLLFATLPRALSLAKVSAEWIKGDLRSMNRSKAIKIGTAFLGLFLLLFLLGPLSARFDSNRTAHGKMPLFCWSLWVPFYPHRSMADGGSTSYEGFGYCFLWKHRITLNQHGAEQIKRLKQTQYDAEGPVDIEGSLMGLDTGVVVSFYLPWYRRFDFETSTDYIPQ
jgi:hypothetical protein